MRGLSQTSKKKQNRDMTNKKTHKNAATDIDTLLSMDPSIVKAELQELKEKGLTERLEIQTKVFSGEFMLRSDFRRIFGRLMTTYRSQVLILDMRVDGVIAAIFTTNDALIRKIIVDISYETINSIQKDLIDFVTES